VQREIKSSIVLNKVKLIVLQDINLDGLSEGNVSEDKLILDNFIENNFKPIKKFGKYNIYIKR